MFDPNAATVQNPDQVKPVYSNNAACMISAHDMRIVFHEIVLNGPSDAPKVELRANVAMSPTEMKALYEAIGQSIQQYEKQFGAIKWPLQQPKTN